MYYNKIKKGENAQEAISVAVCNPNLFYGDGNNLMISCNFKEDQSTEMFYLHPEGMNKIVAKFETKVTIQDFGFIGNQWYFVGIEGQAGKSKHFEADNRGHTSAMFLYDLADNTWANHKEELLEAEMKLHFLDDAKETMEGGNNEVDMIDGFSMVSSIGGQHMFSSTCSNEMFVTWTITKDAEGKTVVTKHQNKVKRSEKDYEVSSWNRKRLYTWSWKQSDGGETTPFVVIDFHSNIDEKIQYLYFLQKLVGDNSAWQIKDLWQAVGMLKAN